MRKSIWGLSRSFPALFAISWGKLGCASSCHRNFVSCCCYCWATFCYGSRGCARHPCCLWYRFFHPRVCGSKVKSTKTRDLRHGTAPRCPWPVHRRAHGSACSDSRQECSAKLWAWGARRGTEAEQGDSTSLCAHAGAPCRAADFHAAALPLKCGAFSCGRGPVRAEAQILDLATARNWDATSTLDQFSKLRFWSFPNIFVIDSWAIST